MCVLHFAEYKLNSSRKNKCRFCSAMQRYGGWERGRGDTCLPRALNHLLVEGFLGHRFGAGGRPVASAHLKEGGAGGDSRIPALGASSSSGGIEIFGQANALISSPSSSPLASSPPDFEISRKKQDFQPGELFPSAGAINPRLRHETWDFPALQLTP